MLLKSILIIFNNRYVNKQMLDAIFLSEQCPHFTSSFECSGGWRDRGRGGGGNQETINRFNRHQSMHLEYRQLERSCFNNTIFAFS